MTFQIIECEQRSEAWYAARMGIPTASEFDTVLPKSRGAGAGRRTYMAKLAGERITKKPMRQDMSLDMKRGIILEPTAREAYSIITGHQLTEVGFIRNGETGCSPDRLIGKRGMLEIKVATPHILIGLIDADEFPDEHRAQCQGNLMVAERDWIDLAVYCDAPNMPMFIKRAKRDEEFISKLTTEIYRFNEELEALVEKVVTYA